MARPRAIDHDSLIQTAAKLFQTRGYQNTTIDDIAKAARISKPTVYQYAKSKQWLLEQAFFSIIDDLDARLTAVAAADISADDQLRETVRVHVEAAMTHRSIYALVFSEQTELSTRARGRFRRWARGTTDDFAALLERCDREGFVRARVDPGIAANLILSMLTSLHRWYRPDRGVPPDVLHRQILLLLSGYVHVPTAVAHSA